MQPLSLNSNSRGLKPLCLKWQFSAEGCAGSCYWTLDREKKREVERASLLEVVQLCPPGEPVAPMTLLNKQQKRCCHGTSHMKSLLSLKFCFLVGKSVLLFMPFDFERFQKYSIERLVQWTPIYPPPEIQQWLIVHPYPVLFYQTIGKK